MTVRVRKLAALASAVLLAIVVCVSTSVDAAKNAAETARVGGDIQYLASDELEGRGPDSEGLEKAAHYIRAEFQKLGLKSGAADGSYFQPFEIPLTTEVVKAKTSLVLNGPDGQTLTLDLGKDYQPQASGGAGTVKADVVFAGYGISAPKLKYDDYANSDVAGKVVLIIRREPQQNDPKSAFDGKKGTAHAFIRTKIQQAKKNKAAAVIMVNDPFTTKTAKKDQLTAPAGFGTRSMGLPFAQMTQALADKLLASSPVKSEAGGELKSLEAITKDIDKTFKPLSQKMTGWSAELTFAFQAVKTEVKNVVGVLEGEGPLAEETIVIGAHYDHLGYGPLGSRKPIPRAIHNGADDNASGTAAIMELARRFSQRDAKPARRMVFIGFSAEERGLIGSNFYVSNPLFPLEKTVAMMNFDMIGRLGPNGLNVGGVATAKEFAGLAEKANADEQLKLKTLPTMGGSDHARFYGKGIPVIAFFTGLTKEYHTPADKFETINVDGVVQTIDYAERFLDSVIALEKRPQYVKVVRQRRGRGAVAYIGIVPDYSAKSEGIKITDVNKNSPAEKAGLKNGDVILQMGDVPVTDNRTLITVLRKHKPGEKVKLAVQRGEKKLTLELTLGKPPGSN